MSILTRYRERNVFDMVKKKKTLWGDTKAYIACNFPLHIFKMSKV